MTAKATRANILAYYANFVTQGVLGIVLNPALLAYLGPVNLGIWKTCQRFFDVAGAGNGGGPQALKWLLASRMSHNDVDEKRRYISGSVIVWLLWLAPLVAVSGLIVVFLPSLVRDVGPELHERVRLVGIILSLNVALGGLLSIPTAALIAANRGYSALALATVLLVVTNLAMIGAAWAGYGLMGVCLAWVAGAVVTGGLTWMLAKLTLPWWGFRRPTRGDVGRLAGAGGWVLVWDFMQRLMLSVDLLLISALVGAAAVAQYTFTSYAAQLAVGLCLLTASAMTPRLSTLLGAGQGPEAVALVGVVRETTIALGVIAVGGILLLNRSFVTTWAGAQNYMGDGVNVAMCLAVFQLVLIRAEGQLLEASLAFRSRAITSLAAVLLGIVLAVLAYEATHSVVALFGGLVVGRVVASVGLPLHVRQSTGSAPRGWVSYLGAAAILAASAALGHFLEISGWLMLLLTSLGVALVLAAACFGLILSPATRSLVVHNLPLVNRLVRSKPSA